MRSPAPQNFEHINCHLCNGNTYSPLLEAEDDLTGKSGRFQFVTCDACGFAFQNPRLKFEHIGAYYDDEYIAHRKKIDWGMLTPFYEWAMGKHDRDKLSLIQRYLTLNPETNVLDIGCGSGSFLSLLNEKTQANVTGIDFKDLSALPTLRGVNFKHGIPHEQNFGEEQFDLITMWHFLEHDYFAEQTLSRAKELLTENGRLIIEVPRLDSLTYKLYKDRWPGLQAPQHTALYTRKSLIQQVEQSGFKVVEYLPYGAFPPYFYVFTGLAFKFLKGSGLNLQKAILPYFIGQLLTSPIMLFQKRLNLAMQTVICER